MRSEEKLAVEFFDKDGGRRWVRILHKKTGFRMIPSFEDCRRMLVAIALCEDKNYPPPNKGAAMVAELLSDPDFLNPFVKWETLAAKYKIPLREAA
jgi:hypothetical protein